MTVHRIFSSGSIRRLIAPVAVATATLTIASTAAPGSDAAAEQVPPSTDKTSPTHPIDKSESTDHVPAPDIDWGECPSEWGQVTSGDIPPQENIRFDCATVPVPLDYDEPDGQQIQIAAKRIPATDQENKIGTIFFNPGGPGGSGVDVMDVIWSLYPETVRAKFDLVGFDPRGVGRSNPLRCFNTDAESEAVLGDVPSFPLTEQEYQQTDAALTATSRACATNAADIAAHASTANVARDMDVLRRAVGDEALTYVGYSYGSQLGTTYANLFPQKIRAMVIDSVIDPNAWGKTGETLPVGLQMGSHEAARGTLEQFYDRCEEAGPRSCALAALGDPQTITEELLDKARQEPLTMQLSPDTTAEITYQDLTGALLRSMYEPETWSSTAQAIAMLAVMTDNTAEDSALPAEEPSLPVPAPQAAAALRALQEQTDEMPLAPRFSNEGAFGSLCADRDHSEDRRSWFTLGQQADTSAAPFGAAWAWRDAICASWPVQDTDRYTGPWAATTSNPVLIMANTYDPATGYPGARAAQRTLAGSRLVTVEGYGHVADGKSACAASLRDTYLLSGRLPAADTVCQQDVEPFPAEPVQVPDPRDDEPVRPVTRERARRMLHRSLLDNAFGEGH